MVPPSVTEGGHLTLALIPSREAGVEAHDLYVSFIPDGERSWMYLEPGGTWSARPVAYSRVSAPPLVPLVVRFDRVGPSGWYTFRVLAVGPADPPSRKHYVFPPLRQRVRIRPAMGALVQAPLAVLTVTAATALAILVLWIAPPSPAGGGRPSAARGR